MKSFAKAPTAVLGLAAACAACCAVPIALPAILAIGGATSASLGAGPAAIAIGAAAISLFVIALWQRARKKVALPTQERSCGASCDAKACR